MYTRRSLKLKCDRNFPCSNCRKRGHADVCPEGAARPPGRAVRLAAELQALLRRVEQLEAVIVDLGHPERIPPPLHLEEATKRSTTVTKELEASIAGSTDASPHAQGSKHSEDDDADADAASADEDTLDAVLLGVGSLSLEEGTGRARFLGASAGSAYYDPDPLLASSGEESPDPPLSPDPIVRHPFIQIGPEYPQAAELERLRTHLPAEEELYRLASNYWGFLAFQFTPLEEDLFFTDYVPAALSPGDPHGTKLACVFAILALGCVFDPDAPSTPNADAHRYVVLCQATLAASRFLRNNDLPASQTLQLLANWFLNYHDLREGGETYFPILGMAVRLLVTQGLHRDPSNFGFDDVESDRRRRVFYELVTIERMQAFISGRPYMMHASHFDTKFPSDAADTYQVAKWKIGLLIGDIIDEAFSLSPPSYATVLKLDGRVRTLVQETPGDYRSGALPADAFVVKRLQPSVLPDVATIPPEGGDVIHRLRAHTLDQMFGQVLFYLHKPAFAQALLKYSDEPLRSPWAASVAAVTLETAVYLLAVAKSWNRIDPVLCPRWWHIYFHAFAASVAQSSLVIKSPRSTLAPHAWSQLNDAVRIFEEAGSGGAPVAAYVPRLHVLREKAYLSLQNAMSVPTGLDTSSALADELAAGTDVSLSVLAPPTRLARSSRPRRKSTGLPMSSSRSPRRREAAQDDLPTTSPEYTPYDSPVLVPGAGLIPPPQGIPNSGPMVHFPADPWLEQQLSEAPLHGYTPQPPPARPSFHPLASSAAAAAAIGNPGVFGDLGRNLPNAPPLPTPPSLPFGTFATSFETEVGALELPGAPPLGTSALGGGGGEEIDWSCEFPVRRSLDRDAASR